ncbi:hypothetical protein LMIY3S_03681 [Labrys miyagiensis]
MMRASIEALVTANQTLQTQVSAVSNYIRSLPEAGAGLTDEESAAIQSVTDGITSASSTLSGLVPAPQAPAPEQPAQ